MSRKEKAPVGAAHGGGGDGGGGHEVMLMVIGAQVRDLEQQQPREGEGGTGDACLGSQRDYPYRSHLSSFAPLSEADLFLPSRQTIMLPMMLKGTIVA
eukprot:gene8415-biopygen4538